MNFITEGDLCRLAAKSELPGANEFESWIFDEVIPAILRTGTYSIAPVKTTRPPGSLSWRSGKADQRDPARDVGYG